MKFTKTTRRFFLLWILLCGIATVSGWAVAAQSHYEIDPSKETVVLADEFYAAQWMVLPDIDESIERSYFANVIQPSFQNQSLTQSSLTYSLKWQKIKAPYVLMPADRAFSWIAIELTSPSIKRVDKVIELLGIGAVAWYLVDDAQQVIASHTDDFDSIRAGRQVYDAHPIIPIQLGTGETVQLFIGLYSVGGFRWDVNLWDAETFREARLRSMMINGLYFGLVLTLVLACFVAFVALRDLVYLYFAFFLTSTGVTVSLSTGLFQLLLLEDTLDETLRLVLISTGAIDFFAAIFSIALLKIHRVNPVLFVAWGFVILFNLFSVGYGVSIATIEQTREFDNLVNLIYVATFATLFEQIIYVWTAVVFWRTSIVARLWFLVIFFHSAVYILWSVFSGFPDLIAIDPAQFVQIATLFDATLLSILLVYTFRTERAERMIAQNLSIENLRLARDIEQAKSNFVSTVSHDLHGPVRAIGFFAEALKKKFAANDGVELQRIEENVETVSRLLESIVRLSEVDAQRQIVVEKVDLSQIFYTLKNEFEPIARSKNLQLLFTDVECEIETDPVAFSQILRNLIQNGIKYTRQGSVAVLVEQTLDYIRISVVDTGQGISASHLGNVFDQFYQVSQKESDGVGLGLSIVARLTELLGIEVNVSSVVGEGSRFELQMPWSIDAKAIESDITQTNSASLSLIGAALGESNLEVTSIVQQLQAWGVTMITQATPQDEVDFVVVSGTARGVDLAKDFGAQVWVLVVGEVADIEFDDPKLLVIPPSVEPMQLRAIMQRVLKSV